MNKKTLILLLSLLISWGSLFAQNAQKSELQQRAEKEIAARHPNTGRFLYIRAYEDYFNKGQFKQGVECASTAANMFFRDNSYKEAFELLRNVDQTIDDKEKNANNRAALHYQISKVRMQTYMKLRKPASIVEQLRIMESLANTSKNDDLKFDVLYNKAIYHYTFGQVTQGNAVFKEMASKLTTSQDYDKLDEVYKTLIDNGRKSGNANMVAQSYSSYIAWKDSITAQKRSVEVGALNKQIADNEATIADKDSSLTTRQVIIIGLGIVAAALAAALILGGIVLLRYMVQNRKLKKNLDLSNENNALKAKFISNISAQLEPTLKKLDSRLPEVKAMQDFTSHIQTLSELESMDAESVEMAEIQVPKLCEEVMDQIRNKVKKDVRLTVEAPKMSVKLNKEFVSHILLHLLNNAAKFTPAEGHIKLEFKKRGAHKFQFLVTDSGQGIDAEKRSDVFKPFLEIKDLTTGDGLGLPICKQMALKMNGDLDIDAEYTKGTRFVLDLQA